MFADGGFDVCAPEGRDEDSSWGASMVGEIWLPWLVFEPSGSGVPSSLQQNTLNHVRIHSEWDEDTYVVYTI